MKKQEKVFAVKKLTEKIKEAKSIVLADYRGLKANQANALRSQIKKMGGEVQIVKNTLLLRSLAEAGLLPESKGDDQVLKIEGPTIALLANNDEITALKAFLAFGKNADLLTLKAGFIEGKLLEKEALSRFAALPGKAELRAMLVGLLAQPTQKLVYNLNFNLQKLVIILGQVKNKKSN